MHVKYFLGTKQIYGSGVIRMGGRIMMGVGWECKGPVPIRTGLSTSFPLPYPTLSTPIIPFKNCRNNRLDTKGLHSFSYDAQLFVILEVNTTAKSPCTTWQKGTFKVQTMTELCEYGLTTTSITSKPFQGNSFPPQQTALGHFLCLISIKFRILQMVSDAKIKHFHSGTSVQSFT